MRRISCAADLEEGAAALIRLDPRFAEVLDRVGPLPLRLRYSKLAFIKDYEGIAMRALAKSAAGRHATPRDIANVVLFLASDEAAFCHGAEYLVDGGHTAGHIWFATG